MKFRVERDVLADAAAWVVRSLPARPPVPVLGGVLIEASGGADGDRLLVSGFDYETSARVELDATIGDPGRVLVSGRLLADITKALPSKPVDLVVDGSRATINCGSSRFSLPTMPVEDYPQLPAMPQLAGTVPGRPAGRGRRQVAVAAGRDDTLPMLTGIRLEIEGSRLTLAATDRFRLAVRELDWAPEDTEQSSGGADPGTHAGRGGQDARWRRHGRRWRSPRATACSGITGAGRRATTRLLDAEFPRFRQLIPAEHTSAAVLEVATLVEAIKRVALVTDRVAQVRMEFGEDGLRLAAGGDDVGSAEEELPCEFEGDAADDRVQPRLPARLARRAAHRARPAHLHHAEPSRHWCARCRRPPPATATATRRSRAAHRYPATCTC